jgi:hypothetical protein
MSSNLGLLYSEGESLSESRLNAKSVFSGSGPEITALPSSKQIPIARCIETGDGFSADELYFQSADGLSYLNVRRKHTHSADTDIAGGTLNDILIANPKQIYINLPDPRASEFIEYKHASSPAIANSAVGSASQYVVLQTGTTSGHYTGAYKGGVQLGFAKAVLLRLKMQLSHNANMVFRAGAGIENVQDTTSNTNKIGMEGCAGTGTTIQLVTGNSLGRTATDTTVDMTPSPAQLRGYKMLWDPVTADVKWWDSDGNTKTATATLPSSGAIVSSSLVRIGINTTNITAKTLYLGGLLLVGEDQDSVHTFA